MNQKSSRLKKEGGVNIEYESFDPKSILDKTRSLIESISTRIHGYQKSPYFDFPQETSSSFQSPHIPSLEEEGGILDWKQGLLITIPEYHDSSSESQAITYKTITNPLATFLGKQ